MADVRKAIEAVKLQARTFQAVIDLANALESIGSVEQAQREASLALHKLGQEREALQAELATLRVELDTQHATARQIVQDAEHAARQARESTQRTCEEMLRAAKAEGDEIQTNARAAEDGARILTARAAADVKAARAELAELTEKITRAKEAMAKILGA